MSVTQINSLIAAQSADALTIARQVVAVETPNTRAAREQQQLVRSRSDALRDINARLAALQTELDELGLGDVVMAKTATTDTPPGRDPTMIVRAERDVLDGEYRVWIAQLATHTKVRSSGPIGERVDPTAPLSRAGLTLPVVSGRFRINGELFVYNAATETLAGLLARIHASTAAVSAAYDPATATITLTARYPGDLPIILVEEDGTFLTAARLREPVIERGQNARVRVEGPSGEAEIEQPSNTVVDLIPGLTLELVQAATGPVTVRVRRDLVRPLRAARGVVGKLNQLMAALHRALSATPGEGDAQVRAVHARLRQILTAHAGRLRDAGVQVDEGRPAEPLKLDERRFTALVARQPERVQADLGLGAAEGFVSTLRAYVHSVLAQGGLGLASESPAPPADAVREQRLRAHVVGLQESLQLLRRQDALLAAVIQRF